MRGYSLDLQGLATGHPGTLARPSHIFSSDLRETPYFAGVSGGNASEHFLRNPLKTIPSNSRRDPFFFRRYLRRRTERFCEPFFTGNGFNNSAWLRKKPRRR